MDIPFRYGTGVALKTAVRESSGVSPNCATNASSPESLRPSSQKVMFLNRQAVQRVPRGDHPVVDRIRSDEDPRSAGIVEVGEEGHVAVVVQRGRPEYAEEENSPLVSATTVRGPPLPVTIWSTNPWSPRR